jgi:hypothetical protein
MAQSNFLNVRINPKIIFEGAATLVIALAFNSTMREVIDSTLPKSTENSSKIVVNIIYTVLITLIVLTMVYVINKISDAGVSRLYGPATNVETPTQQPKKEGMERAKGWSPSDAYFI